MKMFEIGLAAVSEFRILRTMTMTMGNPKLLSPAEIRQFLKAIAAGGARGGDHGLRLQAVQPVAQRVFLGAETPRLGVGHTAEGSQSVGPPPVPMATGRSEPPGHYT